MRFFIATLFFILFLSVGYFSIDLFVSPKVVNYSSPAEVGLNIQTNITLPTTTSSTTTTNKKTSVAEAETTTTDEIVESTEDSIDEVKPEPKIEETIPEVDVPLETVEESTAPQETIIVPNEEQKMSLQSFNDINTNSREALVNIFCITTGPHPYITPISGSGVIIDERGVILTNAHIAQFYLFENFPKENFVSCQIRTGSPAKAAYKAKLLYLSPLWISENVDAISTENPTGTGEHDFAFLFITEPVKYSSLPEEFPFIEIDTTLNNISREDSLLVGGYPAGFLGGRTIQQDLYASTAITEAMELYTFDDTGSLDLVSLGGTVVSQQGSSGGFAVNEFGELVGIISTASDGDTTGERDLRAVTIEHIERSLQSSNNTDIQELISGNLNAKADGFTASAGQTLLQILLSGF